MPKWTGILSNPAAKNSHRTG